MRGAKYFVKFVNDFMRKVYIYMINSKGEWFERFKEFQAFAEMQSEHEIKAFQLMSGWDFISKDFEVVFNVIQY